MDYISKELKRGSSLSNTEFDAILRERKSLPIYPRKSEIIDLVERHPVVIIKGDTGCGKTTQVCLKLILYGLFF